MDTNRFDLVVNRINDEWVEIEVYDKLAKCQPLCDAPDQADCAICNHAQCSHHGRLWVGTCGLYFNDHHLTVTSLNIAKTHRRLGIATAILEKTQHIADQERLPLILHVERNNRPARALYDKLGFSGDDHGARVLVMQWLPPSIRELVLAGASWLPKNIV